MPLNDITNIALRHHPNVFKNDNYNRNIKIQSLKRVVNGTHSSPAPSDLQPLLTHKKSKSTKPKLEIYSDCSINLNVDESIPNNSEQLLTSSTSVLEINQPENNKEPEHQPIPSEKSESEESIDENHEIDGNDEKSTPLPVNDEFRIVPEEENIYFSATQERRFPLDKIFVKETSTALPTTGCDAHIFSMHIAK
ncbi:hypothetical protein O9G_001523 [Rozella allomycis CSF55]|uniref:Uncharacterized protein n=1 Tax=Rozella allomycis (strain CSF55) TaxID=988480 RepID=A0A075B4Q4_ROZAC|nr:hypothetical protein O9G_001523 [Rozella allomycis CSF55]|eukprot:EPZ36539.1 hypothetical protein O9G_001523 [Rozella allomycis CSF55]